VHEQQWADINLERGFVRVSKAKRNTPARRLVALSPAAIEWLIKCKARTGPLCSNLAIDRIRGIARKATDAAGKKKFPAIPDNAFRHSFISHRCAASGNVAETALEAGNSPNVIFRHYRELFTKEEGQAWFETGPLGKVILMPAQGKVASA
jgi:integrase